MSMKRTRAVLGLVIAFISVISMIGSSYQVAAVDPRISTDQPIYSIWSVGGTVRITAANLAQRTIYYLWLLKPNAPAAQMVLPIEAGVGNVTSTTLQILPADPPGTYTLSLSTASTFDSRQATVHFGVFGVNAAAYNRTQVVAIAGGGFAVNSTVTLDIRNGNRSLGGYPTNLEANVDGQFTYTLKLVPSTPLGIMNISATGRTFDLGQVTNASRIFTVRATSIIFRSLTSPPLLLERTSTATSVFRLSYPDNSPVTTGNAQVQVVSSHVASNVSLILSNSTTGLWEAAWTPGPGANLTSYHFLLQPSNFTDSYGNLGQGSPMSSSDFRVLPATLTLNLTANTSYERTQNVTVTVIAKYHNGEVANVTRGIGKIIRSDGTEYRISFSNGTLSVGSTKLPVNATIGFWSIFLHIGDQYGNNGTTQITFQVLKAVPAFTVQSPSTTQRTTIMNVTASITYPDGSPITSQVKLTIAVGNQSWTPRLSFNVTTSRWQASYYVVQNATLGQYNITITAGDSYGNNGFYQTFSQVIPANFAIFPNVTQSTVESFSLLDLPVHVTYPNGTALNANAGQVNATYTNSTGGLVTVPLRYNATQGWWHLFFYTPQRGNFTFSFNAADVYGNSGIATDAYYLKVVTPAEVITRKLIIAAIIAAIIPIVLLAWAIITISTRRRKHKP